MDVLCVLHDSDEYGVCRWPLADIARASGVAIKLLKELVDKDVLKGSDKGTEPYIYTPRSGRTDGDPVILIESTTSPCWYSSRFVRDEHIRKVRGSSTRFESGEDNPKGSPKNGANSSPKGGLGEDSSDGPTFTSTSTTSLKEANASLVDSANPPKTRGAKKCPKDFELNDKRLAWLAENAPLVNGPDELDKFKDYTFNRSIVDWDGAWRNWMRKAQGDAAKEANRTAIRTHLNGSKQNLYAGAAAAIYDGAEHV